MHLKSSYMQNNAQMVIFHPLVHSPTLQQPDAGQAEARLGI